MQQYTEDNTEHHPIKRPSIFDRKLIIHNKLFVNFLICTQEYFPRYLWGINFAIILAIAAKSSIKTLRSVG